MGFGQVSDKTIQHHLATFCSHSLKAKGAVTKLFILCHVWSGPLMSAISQLLLTRMSPNFYWRRPLMKGCLWCKMTFVGRWPLLEDNLWWKINFDGKKVMTEIVATNITASQPSERRLTATPMLVPKICIALSLPYHDIIWYFQSIFNLYRQNPKGLLLYYVFIPMSNLHLQNSDGVVQ